VRSRLRFAALPTAVIEWAFSEQFDRAGPAPRRHDALSHVGDFGDFGDVS
jgi:hypothetical protein